MNWRGLVKTKDDETGITLKSIGYLIEDDNCTEDEVIDLIENSGFVIK